METWKCRNLKFALRMPKDINVVTSLQQYLASLPQAATVKVEVGAIGGNGRRPRRSRRAVTAELPRRWRPIGASGLAAAIDGNQIGNRR